MPVASLVALAVTGGLAALFILARTAWSLAHAERLPRTKEWLKNLIFGPLIVVVVAAVPFFLSGLISTGLTAVNAPVTVYMLIAPFAGWCAWLNRNAHDRGMESCGKILGLVASVYFLCWAAASLALMPALRTDLIRGLTDALRCLLVAAPPAIFVWKVAEKRDRVRHGIFTLLLLASLSAAAFLPVEMGAAARWLPDSDWLRFPIAGAVVASLWMPIALVLTLTLGSGGKGLTKIGRAFAITAGIGGLFGLAWAITRALFALI